MIDHNKSIMVSAGQTIVQMVEMLEISMHMHISFKEKDNFN